MRGFTVLFVLLCSCIKTDKTVPNIQQTFPFADLIPKEVFYIDPEKYEVITLENGSIFSLEDFSFEDQHGNIADKEIRLSITSYLSTSSVLLGGMGTVTIDNQVLQTDGMFYIEAFQNGEKLRLRKDKRILIGTKGITGVRDPNMQVFYGQVAFEDQIVVWSDEHTMESKMILFPSEILYGEKKNDSVNFSFSDVVRRNLPEDKDSYAYTREFRERLEGFFLNPFVYEHYFSNFDKPLYQVDSLFIEKLTGLYNESRKELLQELIEDARYYYSLRQSEIIKVDYEGIDMNNSALAFIQLQEKFHMSAEKASKTIRVFNIRKTMIENIEYHKSIDYLFDINKIGFVNIDKYLAGGNNKSVLIETQWPQEFLEYEKRVLLFFKELNTILPMREQDLGKFKSIDAWISSEAIEGILVGIGYSGNNVIIGCEKVVLSDEMESVSLKYEQVDKESALKKMEELIGSPDVRDL